MSSILTACVIAIIAAGCALWADEFSNREGVGPVARFTLKCGAFVSLLVAGWSIIFALFAPQ